MPLTVAPIYQTLSIDRVRMQWRLFAFATTLITYIICTELALPKIHATHEHTNTHRLDGMTTPNRRTIRARNKQLNFCSVADTRPNGCEDKGIQMRAVLASSRRPFLSLYQRMHTIGDSFCLPFGRAWMGCSVCLPSSCEICVCQRIWYALWLAHQAMHAGLRFVRFVAMAMLAFID